MALLTTVFMISKLRKFVKSLKKTVAMLRRACVYVLSMASNVIGNIYHISVGLRIARQSKERRQCEGLGIKINRAISMIPTLYCLLSSMGIR